jgi:hypothetical protein
MINYYDAAIPNAVGPILLLILVTILVIKGLVQAYDDPRSQTLNRLLTASTVPLLLLFGVVVLLRILSWLVPS